MELEKNLDSLAMKILCIRTHEIVKAILWKKLIDLIFLLKKGNLKVNWAFKHKYFNIISENIYERERKDRSKNLWCEAKRYKMETQQDWALFE